MAYSKKNLLLLNKNKQLLHMRYHLFLKYSWFPQNLGKEAVQTNMHTTVFYFSGIAMSVEPVQLKMEDFTNIVMNVNVV